MRDSYEHRGLHRLLLPLLVALAMSACTGIVVEPADQTTVSGSTKFWGYAIQAGEPIRLEALSTSNQWEVLASTTSVGWATYAGSTSGFYYEVTYNPRTAPTRFRRAASTTGYSTIHFRIKSPNFDPAETRRDRSQTGVQPGSASYLERLWPAYKGDGILRISFQN